MALAQPTPIFGSLPLNITSGTHRKNEKILDIPGPAGSFAVVDIYFPNLNYLYSRNVIIKVNGKFLLRPFNHDMVEGNSGRTSSIFRGIVVPGGATINIEYEWTGPNYPPSDPNDFMSPHVTISGLFYKAS